MINKGIIIISTQGYSNRMRMISCADILCKYLTKKLFICWENTPECNIQLKDIFQNEFNEIKFNDLSTLNYLYFGRVHTETILDNIIELNYDDKKSYDYIIIEGGHEFKLNCISINDFIKSKHLFYNSLVYNNIIQEKVNKFKKKYNMNNIIGIHYREIINEYDGADLNNNDIINFSKNSPFEKYSSIISKLKNYDYILLISNDSNIKDKFKLLSDKIIFTEPSGFSRNNVYNMIDSIVDNILLSQTNMIIGSFFSSFSDEATFYRLIPKIMPLSDEIINKFNNNILLETNYHCYNFSYNNNYGYLNKNDYIIKYLDL